MDLRLIRATIARPPNIEAPMTTRIFRPLARSRWPLALCLIVLSLATLATRAHPVAAGNDTFHVMIPLVMVPSPALTTVSTLELQVVSLTNDLRALHGCPALQISPELMAAAQGHSQEMADHNYFDHVDLSG